MGAGNKMEATSFEVADIYATSVCPMARVMRHELRRRGIPKLKVVYSKEPAIPPRGDMPPDCELGCTHAPGTERAPARRRQTPGSNAFVPAVVGLIIAGEVVKDLTGMYTSERKDWR
jgi:tRNA A37 threonylcarbamoyladenosine dehydratase